MAGGNSYPISREYQNILVENLDFFEEVLGLHEETGLGFMATDGDSHLKAQIQEDGDLSLKFVIALDDNFDAKDGRLFLEDEFLFDSGSKEFQTYQRRFSLGAGLSDEHPFLEHQKKFQRLPKPDEAQVQALAKALFKARPRSMPADWLPLGEKFSQAYGNVSANLSKITEKKWALGTQGEDAQYALIPQKDYHALILWNQTRDEEQKAGPVVFKEKFIFDPQTGLVSEVERTWQLNPKYPDRQQAQELADQLNRLSMSLRESGQDHFNELAKTLFATSEKLPLEKGKSLKVLTDHMEDYTLPLAQQVQRVDPEWTVKALDEASGLQLREWPQGQELILSLIIENGMDPSKARLELKESFYLDKAGHFLSHQRTCRPLGEFQGNARLKRKGAAIARRSEAGEAVLSQLVKDLIPFAPEAKPVTPPQIFGLEESRQAFFEIFGGEWQERLVKQREGRVKASPKETALANNLDALKGMASLALEELHKVKTASQGWLASSKGRSFAHEKLVLETLFQEAMDLAAEHPRKTPLEILELAAAQVDDPSPLQKLKKNIFIQKINHIALEPDPSGKAQAWLNLATGDLWDAGLVATAKLIVEQQPEEVQQQERSQEFLALTAGRADWATRGEFLAPAVLEDIGDPWMLGGMMVAPLAGAATEAGLLSRFGKSRKYLAFAAGIGMEAGAFTAIQDVGQSFKGNPAEVWPNFGWHTLSTAMMFTLLRGGHQVTGRARAAMAEGRWGSRLGGRLESPVSAQWPRTASGTVLTAPTPQLKQLTTSGKILSGVMNHGAGISAMWLSQQFAGKWMPHIPDQDWRGGLFDAILGYGHAVMGFRMADGLSMGRLHQTLGQMRMGMEMYDIDVKSSREAEVNLLKKNLEPVLRHHLEKTMKDWSGDPAIPIKISLPLKEVLLSKAKSSDQLELEWAYQPEAKVFELTDSSRARVSEWMVKGVDPILKELFSLTRLSKLAVTQVPTPELPANEAPPSGGSKESSITRAEEILEKIAQEYERGEPDLDHITNLFKQVSTILEIGAKRSQDTDSVDPRIMKVVKAFAALAEEKGIDISPPKDATERILDKIQRISNKGKDRGKIDTLADPNPEESGEYVGVLTFSGGDPIDIRLGQVEKPLYNQAGEVVAKVWGGEQDGQVFIAVEAVEGEPILVEGEPHPHNWIYPVEHPVFTVGGREYTLFQPIEASGARSMVGFEATELADPEEVAARSLTQGKLQEGPIGYESWLKVERTAAGLEVAEKLPEKFLSEEIPWINFQVHRGRSESNHGVANIFRATRILVGAHPKVTEGQPATKPFRVIGADGKLAEEQALVFLDTLGYINLVRLETGQESQTVLVDGKEIRSEIPVRVFRNSVIHLKAKDGTLFQLDLVPDEMFHQQFTSPKDLDTQARIENVLSDPDTTSITSARAKYPPKPEAENSTENRGESEAATSGLHLDTFFGKSLMFPEDGTMVAPNPEPSRPAWEEKWQGSPPEIEETDFTHLSSSRREDSVPEVYIPDEDYVSTPGMEPPREETVNVPITVVEGSEPKSKPEAQSKSEDYFDLPEDEPVETPHEDSMAGFDASFMGDEAPEPVEAVKLESTAAPAPPSAPAPQPPQTVTDIFGIEAGVMQRAYEHEFGKDPFEGAQPVYAEDGKTVKRIEADGRVMDLEVFLERLAISIRRQVKARKMAEANTPGGRMASLAKIWEHTFAEPLIDTSKQKVIFDNGQPEAIKDLETNAYTGIEEFLAAKEAYLDRGLNQAEENTNPGAPAPSESSPRLLWTDADAPLSEHIAFIESELGIRVGEARIVDSAEQVPPPPPMAEPQPDRPEELLSPLDLAEVQADYDRKQAKKAQDLSVEEEEELIPHPDVLALTSKDRGEFEGSVRKANQDIKLVPLDPRLSGPYTVRGRIHDALGFVEQLRQRVVEAEKQGERVVSLGTIDQLQESFVELYQGSQDYALVSDGRTLKASTFLTEGTRSVKGDMGKPDGILVIPFHADQSRSILIARVVEFLKGTQVPVEITVPLNGPTEGIGTIVVKYSDPFVADILSQVNDMMAADPGLFADHRLFLSSKIDWPGEPISEVSHYRLIGTKKTNPLLAMKRLLVEAKDAAVSHGGEGRLQVFRDYIQQALKNLGLIG